MPCLKWMYYRVAMNIKPTMRCWLGYYEFRLLTNGCMSISNDLLLYFIKSNCEEWLYKYYEESTVVFYLMLLQWTVVWVLRGLYCCILLNVIVMNFCMSITVAMSQSQQINYPSFKHNTQDSIEQARGRSHEEVSSQIFMLYVM